MSRLSLCYPPPQHLQFFGSFYCFFHAWASIKEDVLGSSAPGDTEAGQFWGASRELHTQLGGVQARLWRLGAGVLVGQRQDQQAHQGEADDDEGGTRGPWRQGGRCRVWYIQVIPDTHWICIEHESICRIGKQGVCLCFHEGTHFRRKELVSKEQTFFFKHFQLQNIDRRNSCFPFVNFLAFLSSEKIFLSMLL